MTSPFINPVSSAEKDEPLKKDIRYLGRVLGDVVREQEGEEVFGIIEAIRTKSSELESALTELYNAAQQAAGAAGAGPVPQPDVEPTAEGEDEGEGPRQAKGKVVDAEVVDAEN